MRAAPANGRIRGGYPLRSVEKVNGPKLNDGRCPAAGGRIYSPPLRSGRKALHRREARPEITARLGCRPIYAGLPATGRLRSDPLNLAGHAPVKGVRH
jgi:hypothetical protein